MSIYIGKKRPHEELSEEEIQLVKRARITTGSEVIQRLLVEKVAAAKEVSEEKGDEARKQCQEIFDLFGTAGFERACASAFKQVDGDGSGSIEKEELVSAFKLLVEMVPGATTRLQDLGITTEEHFSEACNQIVLGVAQLLGKDESTDLSLNEDEFSTAIRIMWIKLSA